MKLGVSRVTLSRVVTGASGISADMAYRLAQAFGTSVQMWVVCGGPSLVGQGAWLHRPVLLRTLPRTFAKQNQGQRRRALEQGWSQQLKESFPA